MSKLLGRRDELRGNPARRHVNNALDGADRMPRQFPDDPIWTDDLLLRVLQGGLPTLVFSPIEGGLLSPDNLSRDWARTVRRLKLPTVSFHALRHSREHAAACGSNVHKRLASPTLCRAQGGG